MATQTFTRQEWAQAFAPGATQRVLDWIIGWTLHEYGGLEAVKGTCSYNLLNTHLGNGRKCYGDAGLVSAYNSLSEGAQANRSVLGETNHPSYKALNDAITANDINTLNSAKISPALFTWVGFPTYNLLFATFETQGRGARNSTLTAIVPDGSGGGNTSPAQPDPCDILPSNQKVACTLAGLPCNSLKFPSGADPAKVADIIYGCKACVAATMKLPDTGETVAQCLAEFGGQAGAVPAGPLGGDGGSLPGTGFQLPTWLSTPDWGRVLKFVVGLLAVGFGLVLLVGILTEKGTSIVTNSAAYRGVSKIAALGA